MMRTLLARRPWLFALALSVVLLAANLVIAPQFGAPANWAASLGTLAPFVLVGLASTPAVLSGGIDVSIGPLATFVNCIFIAVLIPAGLGSLAASLPILLAVGLLVGAINGVLVAVLRFNAVVATTGTLFVLTGGSLVLAQTPVTAPENWTSNLAGSLGVLPGALLTMLVPALAWLLLRRTAYVRNLMSVGGDDIAAFSAGVDVTSVRVATYALGGGIAAVGGIALSALIQSAESSLATTYALIALAAVVLGGTPLGGGRGGLLGSFFGACAIYLLQQLLNAAGVQSNLIQLVYGVVLVIGVVLGSTVLTGGRRRTA